VLGGEHSASPPVVRAFTEAGKKVGVIQFDAHLDFRDQYLGVQNSHACAARRISEAVGVDNVIVIGVRSFCKEEIDDAKDLGLKYFTAEQVHDQGIVKVMDQALDHIQADEIYLTVDADGLDPAYAPGVGNPEPFGLSDRDLKRTIDMTASRLVGFDFVEVCPPFDNGNTSALAARIVREVIAQKKR
jgi:agmatinase